MKLETINFSSVDGWSKDPKTLKGLDSSSTLVLIFGAPSFKNNTDVIKQLVAVFSQSLIAGGSTAGEIFQDSVRDESLSVAICKFEKTSLKLVTSEIAGPEKSLSVGRLLGEKLGAEGLSGVFVISDGLAVNGSSLVAGIQEVCPHVPITGGLAADGDRFKATWIIDQGVPKPNFVSVIGFYGSNFRMSHGSQGGWDIFGPERRITKSKGSVLYELDGKPALDLYKEYLGEMASGLPATALLFSLQLRSHSEESKKIVRTILSIDEKSKAMIFAGDVPQNYLAQLMRGNFDRLVDGAAQAAGMLTKRTDVEGPCLAIAISCVGRRLVLGERIEEEVEATLSRLAPGSQQIGFYSYGEISPVVKGESCELHNQTMTITTLSEAA